MYEWLSLNTVKLSVMINVIIKESRVIITTTNILSIIHSSLK